MRLLPAYAAAVACLTTVSALAPPACQLTAPREKNLTSVRTSFLDVPDHPFGIVYGNTFDVAFVALNETLGVLDTTDFTPRLIHEVPLPLQDLNDSIITESTQYRGIIEGATGITITHDGRYVLVTAFSTWLIVIDATRAAAGRSNAVVGAINGTSAAGNSAIEVAVTKDGRYAFVTQEDGSRETTPNGTLEVYELGLPENRKPLNGKTIGYLTLGPSPVGMAFSPNEKYLYVTSEGPGTATTPQGTLSVIDVEAAKRDPSKALVSTAIAGCGAVRVIASADGKTVWVTVRESNHLVAFDAERLVSCPDDALVAAVQAGTSPVGLTFARNESRILTADSNRFGFTNVTSGVSVVDVQAALSGKEASLGQIMSGSFPREFAASPDGETVLLSVYGSAEVQAIDVSTLP